MKNLENLQLKELTIEEQVNIEGGWVGGALKALGRVMVVAGVWDAVDDFKKGWDSVDCGCKK